MLAVWIDVPLLIYIKLKHEGQLDSLERWPDGELYLQRFYCSELKRILSSNRNGQPEG
jgi:hypothetical protein